MKAHVIKHGLISGNTIFKSPQCESCSIEEQYMDTIALTEKILVFQSVFPYKIPHSHDFPWPF